MATIAHHLHTVESFVDCMHSGADTDTLATHHAAFFRLQIDDTTVDGVVGPARN